jgi:hypothetical protein
MRADTYCWPPNLSRTRAITVALAVRFLRTTTLGSGYRPVQTAGLALFDSLAHTRIRCLPNKRMLQTKRRYHARDELASLRRASEAPCSTWGAE